MTETDIRNAGGIYFEKISEGFEQYRYKCMKMNQRQAYIYLSHLWNLSRDTAYSDFYYSRLDQTAREKIRLVLTEQEWEHLEQYRIKTTALFIPLEQQLLKIHLKLNEEQQLFSTFYFTANPCTVWASYNQEYVIFKF